MFKKLRLGTKIFAGFLMLLVLMIVYQRSGSTELLKRTDKTLLVIEFEHLAERRIRHVQIIRSQSNTYWGAKHEGI